MKKSRREHLESWGLVLVSAVFVVTGVVLLFVAASPAMPIAAIVFFGACGIMGVTQLVEQRQEKRGSPSDSALPVWAAAFASAMIAVACGALLVAVANGTDNISFIYQGFAAPAAIAGILFFGGGAVYLVVRLLRSRREDDRSRP